MFVKKVGLADLLVGPAVFWYSPVQGLVLEKSICLALQSLLLIERIKETNINHTSLKTSWYCISFFRDQNASRQFLDQTQQLKSKKFWFSKYVVTILRKYYRMDSWGYELPLAVLRKEMVLNHVCETRYTEGDCDIILIKNNYT